MATFNAQDWHRADIIARVRKTGTTLRQLSLDHGYCDSVCKVALFRQWPAVERIIAKRIGVAPRLIWPSRYDADGNPKREPKTSTGRPGVHVQSGGRV